MKKLIVTIILIFLASQAYAKNEHKGNKHQSLPPGLEKKLARTGELPPGWQKKLNKGSILEVELYEIGKKNRVNPSDYSLKPMPGTELLRIENRIIRIKQDSREILDILGF